MSAAQRLSLLDVEAAVELIGEVCQARPSRRTAEIAFAALGWALLNFDERRGPWIPFRDGQIRSALERRISAARAGVVRYDVEADTT